MARKKHKKDAIEASRDIGARFRLVRTKAGLLQSEMADRLFISLSHYSKIESGNNPFRQKIVHDFCRMFGLSERWLLEGEGPLDFELAEDPRTYGENRRSDPGLRLGLPSSDGNKVEAAADGAIEETYGMLANAEVRESIKALAEKLRVSEVDVIRGIIKKRLKDRGIGTPHQARGRLDPGVNP